MNEHSPGVVAVRSWFEEYLDAFAACARGDSDDVSVLLRYYGVPLVFTSDEAALVLNSADEVVSTMRRQVAGLRAERYERSAPLGTASTTVLNATTALHEAAFARLRIDGTEIARLRATYLIIGRPEGRRIVAAAAHAL